MANLRIGVVSDPHGCLVGLRTALDWLAGAGVDRIVCAGDVANFGPQPNACITLLAERGVQTVCGNCDRDMLLPPSADHPADARMAQIRAISDWGRERLTSASRRWLAALPLTLTPLPGVLIVHGGIHDSEEIVAADASPFIPPGISVVAAGHLHTPFITCTAQGLWVNAGSAGRPCDGDPRAALVVLEQTTDGWHASIHRVAFDLAATAQAIRAAKMPYPDRMIETQVNACWW